MIRSTGKMKVCCNHMHLYHRLDYKAFTASWCGFLLAIFLLFNFPPHGPVRRLPHVPLEEIKNFKYEPGPDSIGAVVIDREGKIWIGAKEIEYPYGPKLHQIMENHCFFREFLLLRADKKVEWGKIIEVLSAMRKAGIITVGLITEGYSYPVLDFILRQNKSQGKLGSNPGI